MDREAAGRQFRERLDHVAQATESMLDRLLSTDSLPGESARPPRLVAAMRYAALGGGKRLRPFLVVETARLFGVEGEGVLRTGAALEMIHCHSLVHDDLPAMDDDDLRRGRPTAHRAFDEATAILAGDALLTYAFDVVADPVTHSDPAVRSELVLKMARASGLGGMVGGQVFDLAAEQKSERHTEAAVRELQAMKTGALLLYAVEAGAIRGRAERALPIRVIEARPRLFLCIAIGIVLALIQPHDWRLATRLLIAWNGAVTLYLILGARMMMQADNLSIRRRAQLTDDGKYAFLALSIIAAIASFAAIVLELAGAKDLGGFDKTANIVLVGG